MRFPRTGPALAALLTLAFAGPASAAVNVTAFSVTPTTFGAGANPDVKISTSFSSSPTSDDVKDLTVRLPPGLVGNPTVTAKCSAAQFNADTCPADTALGSVTVDAVATVLALDQSTTSQGTVYNLAPVGSEPARLGIKIRPSSPAPGVTIQPISLTAIAKLGPDTGYALETTIPNQPRTANSSAGPIPLRVTKVDLTLKGKVGGKGFMINPSSCAPGAATVRAVPYDSGAPSTRVASYTATNCAGLAFAPRITGTIGARGFNRRDQNVTLTTVLDFPLGHSSLRDTIVTLPPDVGSNINALGRQCPLSTPLPACPASSKIGSAEAASPLLEAPLRGSVVLRQSSTALTDVVVDLKGASPLTLFGKPSFPNNRVRNTFAGAPDVPLSRFTLKINGEKNGLLVANEDLCRPDKKQVADATLVGWNGKTVKIKSALKKGGCRGYRPPKPTAALKLRRRALSLSVVAGRYTRLRAVRVTLPKGLTAGRVRAKGKRLRSAKVSGRTLRIAFRRAGAPRLVLSSRGLKVSRGLIGRRIKVKVADKDSTGRTVRFAVRTRVRR